MKQPSKPAAVGLSVAAQVITQVMGYLKQHHEEAPEFWGSFMAGLTGGMAANIGFDAADSVLDSVACTHARAK